jgi:hypothetical protein
MSYIYALLIGVAMGFLIQRVGASSPSLILRNLRLENLSIIKFMATTIAIGMLVTYLLSAGGVAMNFDIKPTYVIGVLVGGLIFGVGFAVGGFCPGTCVVAVGEGRRDAWFAIIGGVVGALGYTLAYSALEGILIQPMNYGKLTLQDAVHLPSLVVAVAMAALMLFIVWKLPTEVKKKGA